ncbi:cys met metabolism pyridoxal-phosphate-dependent protein [Chrysochromulina tobinii]|uniref:Cys met metabolism pyridoxal-phosphate-dependent protein n=1 Tax=Chrysochromulina tobinii TaxID=1460289 RepID=A0A0M0JJC2_9EUKA|nr:cys met metabolism pyridoxal-phosphate-dependent protein [Chrysochromulina tobinii]|eukprot:KOO26691.1 cys met metabolism pyridoxal-phosphate-dependent protein [Chrysochromulina sp. CCMP291]
MRRAIGLSVRLNTVISRVGSARMAIRAASSSAVPPGSSTAAVHADALADVDWMMTTDKDVSPPISLSTTYTCPEEGSSGHIYSRISNPTRDRAELLLGAIESTPTEPAHAVLYASGLAATFGVLARLLPRRVAISGGYHGTHLVLSQLQRISGGAHGASVPLPVPDEVASALRPGDLIWLETPRNPDCHVADVSAYVAAARAVGGIHVVVDATFAPPPLQRPLTLGADVVMHSTTKYLAGHSDAIGGALCVSDAALATALKADRTALGATPGSLEPWLLMRSLPVDGSDAAHPLRGLVKSVAHPSLPSDPAHEIARRQMSGGYGGCFALELSTEAAAKALPKALLLFRDATSLGGVESLIEWRRKYDQKISPLLLRCSVGLEEPEHLRADLQRAILEVSR